MADDTERGPVGRFIDALRSPFKVRSTPEPQMPLYTTGIQEPVLAQGITIPALYAVSHENLILRNRHLQTPTGDIQKRVLLGEEVPEEVRCMR